MKYEKFEDLPIWKLSVDVAKNIYNVTSQQIFKNEYSLVNQVRNSAMMVNTNIVDGFESYNDFPKYLRLSKGYVQKLKSQLYICQEVGLLTKTEFNSIGEKLSELINQIGGLIYYMSKGKSSKSEEKGSEDSSKKSKK